MRDARPSPPLAPQHAPRRPSPRNTPLAPQVDDEASLLTQMRQKLGPYASADVLTHHLRQCRGKVTWAVNSYLRAVLAAPQPAAGQEDYQQRPGPCPASQDAPVTAQAPAGASSHAAAVGAGAGAATAGSSSDSSGGGSSSDPPDRSLPEACTAPLLERVLSFLDLRSVCSAAGSCRALAKVRGPGSRSEGLGWREQRTACAGTALNAALPGQAA
jgi:hypothetical protein